MIRTLWCNLGASLSALLLSISIGLASMASSVLRMCSRIPIKGGLRWDLIKSLFFRESCSLDLLPTWTDAIRPCRQLDKAVHLHIQKRRGSSWRASRKIWTTSRETTKIELIPANFQEIVPAQPAGQERKIIKESKTDKETRDGIQSKQKESKVYDPAIIQDPEVDRDKSHLNEDTYQKSKINKK